MRYLYLVLIASLLFTGCGTGDRSEQKGLTVSSPVVRSQPDDFSDHAAIGQALVYASSEASELVVVQDGSESTLPLPTGDVSIMLDVWERGPTKYVVAGTIDSSGLYSLRRWHDSDTDGVPDASTLVVMFETTSAAYLTNVVEFGDERWACLDARCQDIRLALDTDQDSWPDSVSATPFAMSETQPELLRVGSIASTLEDTLEGYLIGPGQTADHGDHTIVMRDTDANGVADEFTTSDFSAPIPDFELHPVSGATTIKVFGGSGSTGRTCGLYPVDAAGVEGPVLGTCQMIASSGGRESEGVITLATGLVLGNRVRIRFTDEEEVVSRERLVREPAPEIVGMDPVRVTEGVSTSVVVRGGSFSATTKVRLVRPDNTFVELTPTFVDSSTLGLVIPASTDCVQEAFLVAYEDAQELDDEGAQVFGFTLESGN